MNDLLHGILVIGKRRVVLRFGFFVNAVADVLKIYTTPMGVGLQSMTE